eukprot:CAMPEP_0175822450 /NCGR_PEP_ID=MMETSP0107_2-20121207/9686_1 /TAXON_ID=195067 ORGANISM="Goniomonas pacifica, Strain CCMP1869" /NCGR_SAMPLE_ID=MMETSP0107_2 /ASSEMBLY_ACC=CAM_ASM_000203 /LENGTH=326 /DNA_ID=CAMNT_0017134919 /DNA_START=37 /DNA_END=1017 /DNA_ORIENTATION=-
MQSMQWLFGDGSEIDLPGAQKAIRELMAQRDELQARLRSAEGRIKDLESGEEVAKLKDQLQGSRDSEAHLRRENQELRGDNTNLRRRLAAACRTFACEVDLARTLRQLSRARGAVFPEPVVLAGPAGVGRFHLAQKLVATHPDHFDQAIVETTAPASAEGEEEEEAAVEAPARYNHLDDAGFDSLDKSGEFLYTYKFLGARYGVTKRAVERVQGAGKVCLLTADAENIAVIKASALNAMCIWLAPPEPQLQVLEQRLRTSKSLSRAVLEGDNVKVLLEQAKRDLQLGASPGLCDHHLVHESFADSLAKLKQILSAFPHLTSTLSKR